MSPFAYLTPTGRLVPESQRQRERNRRPIQHVYESKRWRTETRPAVLERDGHTCVYCGATTHLVVAHRGRTQALLAVGLDIYNPNRCVTTCRAHNWKAAKL